MIEIQFPTYVSKGAVGGDTWQTQVNVLPNGQQQRGAQRSITLGRWSINYSTINKTHHIELRNFKLAVKGGFQSFRYKDWLDYQSDTVAPGQSMSPATGNGVLLAFQLAKAYTVTSPLTAYTRTITKPVSGTLAVYVDSALKVEGANPGGDYTVNYATGVVTFNAGKAPGNTLTVKATYEFDKVARMTNDYNPGTIEVDADGLSLFHHDGIEIEEVNEA